jgi:hypothetical protein
MIEIKTIEKNKEKSCEKSERKKKLWNKILETKKTKNDERKNNPTKIKTFISS